MTPKTQSSFPTVDPAGITPGHDEPVANPPEPRNQCKDEIQGGYAGSKKPGMGDASQEGTPNTDLVSIGTNSSNQSV